MGSAPGARPPHFNPDAPTEDYVPLAAAALGMSILAGAAVEAVVLLSVRGLVAQTLPSGPPDPAHPAGILLLFGTLAACGTAVVSCWAALAPLPPYRRGGLSLLTAFAVVILALLFAPVNEYTGPLGLATAAALASLGAWRLGRRVAALRRAA